MEMRKVLLACVFLCSIVPTIAYFSRVGKPCNDSARPIDDIIYADVIAHYIKGKYKIWNTDSYEVDWVFGTPSDIDIEKVGNILELNCDSSEIKGKGELRYIKQDGKHKFHSFQKDGSTKLDKNTVYTLNFRGKFDKKPTLGDNCELKIYVTLNDEEKSYCTAYKAEIVKGFTLP